MVRHPGRRPPRSSSESWYWEGTDFALGRIVVGSDDPRWNQENCTGSQPALAFHTTTWTVESDGDPSFQAGPNQILFVPANAEYRRRRPPGLAECSDALWVSPRVRVDVVGDYLPDVEERLDRPVPFSWGPRPARLALFQRSLMAYLMSERAPDPLLVEEAALRIYREAHHVAFGTRRVEPLPRRGTTRAAHRDAVRAAEEIIAASYRERLRLGDLARRVGLSPAHFCRVFRRETGHSVHGYVTGLRLSEAIERLPESRGDTTQLALELGFSSRSHFSDALRSQFGVAPTSAAELVTRPSAADLRRTLDI
ncbi:MAG TPA: AraC family transcriptional regulator [bacterium]|nr:AraC family transcriptional regulator [bacterium]